LTGVVGPKGVRGFSVGETSEKKGDVVDFPDEGLKIPPSKLYTIHGCG
jgi:hypothetical protein